ncbi:LexA family transcriptional regulator [uncultured Mucilaginibacter sp.]|uniref:LexA family protein n=1 Tax=uncultured Mucilaginibacter sp. TaxID=797541 RepID=UPI0025F7C9C0|nr:translesion error-prone DNA polymerase V autoproteolytic subunit [uncultured Mucilaginibacter sp.]
MLKDSIELFNLKKSVTDLPLFLSTIQAGFPSPADDYLEEILSLDDICISNAASTFLGRVKGSSLKDITIYEGDILVIDKSLKPNNRDLVVCAIDGEFNAKILHRDRKGIRLMSANSSFEPIIINELTDFRIWGVVTFVIQNIKNRSNDWHY